MHKQIRFLAVLLFFSIPVLADSSLVIDVRTPEEYHQSHVRDAVNIPFNEITDRIAAVTSNRDASIVLYCRSGRRAGVAEQALRQMGYRRIENKGGLNDMQRDGYSIQ